MKKTIFTAFLILILIPVVAWSEPEETDDVLIFGITFREAGYRFEVYDCDIEAMSDIQLSRLTSFVVMLTRGMDWKFAYRYGVKHFPEYFIKL